MKKLVLVAFSFVCFGAIEASAVEGNELFSYCASSLAADSGKTARLGQADVFGGDNCTCGGAANGYCYAIRSNPSCDLAYPTNYGQLVTGAFCCVDQYQLCGGGGGWAAETSNEVEVQSTQSVAASEELQAALAGGMPYYAYFGYIDNANKSPSWGRETSQDAKLDACIGHGNVDAIRTVAGFLQLSTCRGSSYCGSSHNGACTRTEANGETLCQDRCDCVFGGSCNSY